MTADEVIRLRDDLLALIAAGESTDDIEAWADSYTCSRRDLIEVIRLLADGESAK